MPIYEYTERFAGRPVHNWEPGQELPDPTQHAIAVRLDWDAYEDGATMTERLEQLLRDPEAGKLEALVVGAWDFESSQDSSEIISYLAGNASALPWLRALFVGDITGEEQEISWIEQSNVTPLLRAFEELEELRVRGGGIQLDDNVSHDHLRRLVFETGGLLGETARAVASADLPNVEHLELWTGDDNYGATVKTADLADLMSGKNVPGLRSLALRNSMLADDLVEMLSMSPVTQPLSRLDLSLGTLSDVGGQRFLDARDAFTHLEQLDLTHHYLSEEMMARLRDSGLSVVLEDRQEADDWGGELHLYVSVGE